MRHSLLDFNTIERAISYSITVLERDEKLHQPALKKLAQAQEEFKRAFSLSMSRKSGQ